MQRQLSNVSFHSYQDYQPTRKYGPQYEPGGYSAAVQQRTNMTQREDALKFEQGRIKALQEERLHIQKKTFTKWVNSFLQKARMEVDDLFADLADGRRLLKLLEIISGERLPRPNTGRMRVHKIENVNKSLSFLHTKVRLESIGAEDIVDGNPRLILGLIWTIILRFQIQEIEIDVDEENESSEKKSAKDALLLWCQRKTSGYHGVHIHNFTDSWRSGLGFNALIHAHRPDLFRWQEVPVTDHVETLNHAFDVAHANLGIPKLLDAEDVDTSRPDEKSVMTYVASYYHTFARMKNEQKSGKRIANIIGQLMDCDGRKNEYSRLVTALLEWIRMKIEELNDRELPNSLDAIQRLLLAFKQYRTVEKPPKYKERSEIEALYFDINTMNKSLVGEAWSPLEGQLPQDLERAWQKLEQAEHARELALRTELLRQQRLEQLNYKFNTKSVLRKGYLKEMIQVLSDPRYGSNLSQVDATVKKHEAISADILARTERFEDLSAMAAELVRENYHGAEAVSRTEQQVLQRWNELLQLLEGHRTMLAKLAHLMALLREADTVGNTLEEMKAQFQSEEVGRHLVDVERLLQAHALQELQLGAVDESIRRLVRQGSSADGPQHSRGQLTQQLKSLEEECDSLVAAAKDRKARLEDARNLYQFLEDHDEEEGWVTEKQRICRADVSAKDLRAVVALRQKHTALLQELKAREHVSQRHRAKGQSLIDAKHPKSAEISRRLSSLNDQWDTLRELAASRDKLLADAAELHQFYVDANEAESWMKEKRPLVASEDCGSDAPSATALLARHKALHDQLNAHQAELDALKQHASRLPDTTAAQLLSEVDSNAAEEEEEWVNESRLVPTEVWEEEPVERLEHRCVTEERSVPQVKALYAFTGQGISMQKGEVMFLINKTNPDWWSVRKADRTDGFVPANYVREIEPRVVPVQVRRPEKVRTVQRVKKTVLVKQVVPVKRQKAAPRRASRAQVSARANRTVGVDERMTQLQTDYEELMKLSAARRAQLEDAIKLYSFFAECDDFDKWIKDKEKMLRSEENDDTVDTAKRKYEKFVTDLSAASKRLEHIDAAAEELVSTRHSQAGRATARRQQLKQQWGRLLRLKEMKEKSLEGASSVELFGRTCDEALDWMAEKEQQLAATSAPASDLRTVRALQRRHAQLERELEPLREKVNTVSLLADSVKSQYPNEKANVEARQREIQEMWQKCHLQAKERRSRLENAVGHQIFCNSATLLDDWIQKVKEQIAQETVAKDVATAEAQRKQHQEYMDDIKAHHDEFKEVIGLGKQLVGNNPTLTDVSEKIQYLEDEQKALLKAWQERDAYLKQSVELQAFNREADQIDASSGAHEAYLEYNQCGTSVDSVSALLKRHSELEARASAQDERVTALTSRANNLMQNQHYASEHIGSRHAAVLQRREGVRRAIAERRRALLASLAFHQFLEAAEELQAWIQDKTRTAKDQSYRDLANLERKLQKHEAFERELQANEKQLRNVESIGQSLQKSDPGRAGEVTVRLQDLHTAWTELVAASRDKGAKLRQAAMQRKHRRSVEDAKARLVDLERSLKSEEIGTDLRSCKRLMNQHQALEQELTQWQQKSSTLAAQGADLVSDGHFDAPAIERESNALQQALQGLQPHAVKRRQALESSLQLHKFAAEISGELDWVSERQAAAHSDALPAHLHAAQTAQKKHNKLRNELEGRRGNIQRVLAQGREMEAGGHPSAGKIKSLCSQLEEAYKDVTSAAEARASRLEAALKSQQFLHEAAEVESWLADKAGALSSADVGRDRHRATQLLTRHKAVELELDTYAAIISEMGHVAASMASSGHEEGDALVARHGLLAESLAMLQKLAQQRQKALVESVCRHEYLAESAELESWIQEQYAAASSEDYGQDYEHLLILRSKFDELRHRVESGAERFSQCEDLAKKLLASESPYIADIEKRQEVLGESWQRLVEQIQSRSSRLHAAGDIHRFHRDVSELLQRASETTRALSPSPAPPPPRDRAHALALLRDHDTTHNQLLAIDAQIQVLQEEGTRLQKLYPGGNVQQIALQQRALDEAWDTLKSAADVRKQILLKHLEYQTFLKQVRELVSWSAGVRRALCPPPGGAPPPAPHPHPAHAHSARADHVALRAEIDARDHMWREGVAAGRGMVQAGHEASAEIEEKCELLLEERARLHTAWAARQVALDQLIDLHCFLRDADALHELCSSQEAYLSTEISPKSSVEEVDNQLKKHEAFEKLLATQDEKLSTLNSHGDKLLQQNHVESQRIADELQSINERRKKLYASSSVRGGQLTRARARAQFARDADEARGWVADKLATLDNDQHTAEVTNLEDKIKKLQKHQAFTAELAVNKARLQELQSLAAQLAPDEGVQEELVRLQRDWALLEEATQKRGRGLEEAQDILEFNQHLDKIEAWIRDKEMMVQAHELGRDYEHCSALLRKLDDLDSDMKVDDKHVKSIRALADKLLQQGPTQQAESVASRRDAFLAKWKALSGALQKYKENLSAALEIHSFNRDVEDTAERISKKATLFSSSERGKELALAQELKRRHLARAAEAGAINDKIHTLETEGKLLANRHPEHAKHIESSLASLREGWANLQELAAKRTAALDEAIAEHKFDEHLKELELWISESVKRMHSTEPPESVEEAEALLEAHNERKAEIDGRQKAIAALQKEAQQVQPEEKLNKLAQLSATLDQAWLQRKQYLTQAHQLQLLKEQARQTEDWLAAKEAFLNNDDLGDNLEAVETLIRKHTEFSKLLDSQLPKVDELERFARSMLQDGHYDEAYIEKRLASILARKDQLKESCSSRAFVLHQSRQLHEFLRDLRHEQEWIALKMQLANDHNYRELSNLQNKIQKHTAFESELAANKRRIDDVANHGEELIESKHYASNEISKHVEQLESEWRALQSAAKLRRERLQEAYQARVYLRGLGDFTAWLDEVEAQLLSEDHGKDLSSVTGLLKRHSRLEQQVAQRSDAATQLYENATQLAEGGHFMAEEMLAKADDALKRYRQLQEPMQFRRDNLEDAELLHRWDRDADEEMRWLREREAAIKSEECGATLLEAQAMQKKYVALEAELMAREPSINAICARAGQLSRRGHFAGGALQGRAGALAGALRDVAAGAQRRARQLRERCQAMQLLSEISEAEAWMSERRPVLVSSDVGRDEDSAISLVKRLESLQRELTSFDATVLKLESGGADLLDRNTNDSEQLKQRMDQLRTSFEEMKLLSAKRQLRLQQSLKYFKFAQECEEVQEWIGEQMTMAASEDYGLDVEHVDTLQQAFDNFLTQLQANEGRIEAVCEAGNVLLDENTPEAERVRQRIEDIKGLWDDLKELAIARQEALAGARQVHEFDRSADETVAWLAEKEALLADSGAPRQLHALHAARRRLAALRDDLEAIRSQHQVLEKEADRLGTAFPDAKEHVLCKLEYVTECLQLLTERVGQTSTQLQLAEQVQSYFPAYQELLAWSNETLARVTAPELSGDVTGAERLLARHQDILVEIQAKEDAFNAFYTDGEKLVKDGHFMSSEIEERMSTLRSRKAVLDAAWHNRSVIYTQHLDALVFKRDADALENWIATRVPLVRDGKYGDTVAQVEELINRHRDLEETIEVQRDKFNALKRITLVEQAFAAQKNEEEAARRRSAEKQEEERLAQYKKREVERITEERRRETAPAQAVREPASPGGASPEEITPAPQFDRLPKSDAQVKRAESMSVVKMPKRTPSFTTRRRTQSFRRHRRADADLPPLEIEGYLERKQESGCGGKRATVRSWRSYYCVLCGQLLCFFRDELDFSSAKAASPPQAILNARCEPAGDYTKRANVFRLACADGAEYLFACQTKELMDEWVAKLSFHAQLPPELQLTPYSAAQNNTRELSAPIHEDASSSSSGASSPTAVRRTRTQAEILREHRNLQDADQHRNIESTVLPSLPPRQPPTEDEPSDVVLRNTEQSWGRSRFSNGRDINTEFIKSQQNADAPPLPLSGPPDRPPTIPERVTNLPERATNLPERAPNLPERSTMPEQKQSVTALVNSYQQRMSGNNPRGLDMNRNSSAWQTYERQNNNWQNVETTSHFYTGSDLAYGGNRPASVAGGSPALERPASRSSGESELSVSSVTKDKKDKKGVFGGLFSRKKRPQSHM